MKKGTLYLIPLPISEGDPELFLPVAVLRKAGSLRNFVVEEIRTARRFLRKSGYTGDFSDMNFFILNEHTDILEISRMIHPLIQGHDTGLLSEAGMPCVADPGAQLVAIAQRNRIKVVPLTGPSSILMALAASGLNGQNFTFHGYLPVRTKEREDKIRELEKASSVSGRTQIFIEAPYRNTVMLESLLSSCYPATQLCIACNITGEDEHIKTMTIREWKDEKPAIHKKPCIFLIYCSFNP